MSSYPLSTKHRFQARRSCPVTKVIVIQEENHRVSRQGSSSPIDNPHFTKTHQEQIRLAAWGPWTFLIQSSSL